MVTARSSQRLPPCAHSAPVCSLAHVFYLGTGALQLLLPRDQCVRRCRTTARGECSCSPKHRAGRQMLIQHLCRDQGCRCRSAVNHEASALQRLAGQQMTRDLLMHPDTRLPRRVVVKTSRGSAQRKGQSARFAETTVLTHRLLVCRTAWFPWPCTIPTVTGGNKYSRRASRTVSSRYCVIHTRCVAEPAADMLSSLRSLPGRHQRERRRESGALTEICAAQI